MGGQGGRVDDAAGRRTADEAAALAEKKYEEWKEGPGKRVADKAAARAEKSRREAAPAAAAKLRKMRASATDVAARFKRDQERFGDSWKSAQRIFGYRVRVSDKTMRALDRNLSAKERYTLLKTMAWADPPLSKVEADKVATAVLLAEQGGRKPGSREAIPDLSEIEIDRIVTRAMYEIRPELLGRNVAEAQNKAGTSLALRPRTVERFNDSSFHPQVRLIFFQEAATASIQQPLTEKQANDAAVLFLRFMSWGDGSNFNEGTARSNAKSAISIAVHEVPKP